MQLFLIRHPRPLLAAGICYGRLDIEAEDPRPAAERLLRLLPAATPVIASPLRRARGLAEALHPRPRFDRRLMELDFGEWEGQGWNEIPRGLLDAWAADMLHFVPPGGESAAMLQARVIDCVAGLRVPGVALVSHAGAIRALLGHWLRLPIAEWSRLPLAFGSITRLDVEPDAPGVLHYLDR